MNSQTLVIADDLQKIRNYDVKQYVTLPWMTKYEFDQLIGLRTMHLSRGAPPMVDLPESFQIESNMQLRKVALQELQEGRLPYLIKRTLPNHRVEYWPVKELQLDAVRHLMTR
jgi:DNA-directed RNA polymerase subunit K/omega